MFPNKNPKNKLELRSKKAPKTKSKYRLTPIGVSFGPGASFDAVNQRPVSGGVEVKVGTTLGSRGGGGGGGMIGIWERVFCQVGPDLTVLTPL